jgi:hypothetical protein
MTPMSDPYRNSRSPDFSPASESFAQERTEHAVCLLATNHARYLQVNKNGYWGFSQGGGYNPAESYATLTEALQAEIRTLITNARLHRAGAEAQIRKADALDADIAVLRAIAPDASAPSREIGDDR